MKQTFIRARGDGLANPDFVQNAMAAAPSLPGAERLPENPLSPQMRRRQALEAALASKLLEAHLRARVSSMQMRPTDLSDLGASDCALLIRAMAAAGHADGGLEHVERQRLITLARSGIKDDRLRQQLLTEIERPPSTEQLIRLVETPQMAERFYAVSAAVIRRERAVNRSYLAYIASRLGLASDIVLRINRELEEKPQWP